MVRILDPKAWRLTDSWVEGRLCGSSFINERFKDHVKERLEHATYLENDGVTIDQIIESEAIMGNFEHRFKRQMNFQSKSAASQYFDINGLRENKEKNLMNGGFEVSR